MHQRIHLMNTRPAGYPPARPHALTHYRDHMQDYVVIDSRRHIRVQGPAFNAIWAVLNFPRLYKLVCFMHGGS